VVLVPVDRCTDGLAIQVGLYVFGTDNCFDAIGRGYQFQYALQYRRANKIVQPPQWRHAPVRSRIAAGLGGLKVYRVVFTQNIYPLMGESM
jgi:hypothetical protein